jgi:integrase
LEEFYAWNKNNLVETMRRADLRRYRAWLMERKRTARTAAELEPQIYNEDELAAFFRHCKQFHLAVFKTYLMAGLRKQELENLEWTDVDFKAGTISVSPKDGFDPKDWEQRTIEVPDELLHILKSLPRKNRLVFANTRDNTYTHGWDDCAVIGKKAGIAGRTRTSSVRTYATTLLHSGVDLKTVQKLLGHKRLESTMR